MRGDEDRLRGVRLSVAVRHHLIVPSPRYTYVIQMPYFEWRKVVLTSCVIRVREAILISDSERVTDLHMTSVPHRDRVVWHSPAFASRCGEGEGPATLPRHLPDSLDYTTCRSPTRPLPAHWLMHNLIHLHM